MLLSSHQLRLLAKLKAESSGPAVQARGCAPPFSSAPSNGQDDPPPRIQPAHAPTVQHGPAQGPHMHAGTSRTHPHADVGAIAAQPSRHDPPVQPARAAGGPTKGGERKSGGGRRKSRVQGGWA